MGHGRLYLVTDLVGFYEKCGWEYVGEVNELDGGPIRLYGVSASASRTEEVSAPQARSSRSFTVVYCFVKKRVGEVEIPTSAAGWCGSSAGTPHRCR